MTEQEPERQAHELKFTFACVKILYTLKIVQYKQKFSEAIRATTFFETEIILLLCIRSREKIKGVQIMQTSIELLIHENFLLHECVHIYVSTDKEITSLHS